MNNEELEQQILTIVKEHFEDIDKLCELLEKVIDRMAQMESRIRYLEGQQKRKWPDNPDDVQNDLILA